jgi:hypothetical protein
LITRTYNREETCKRLKCDKNKFHEAVLQELANEFMPSTDFVFNKLPNNDIEVKIIPEEEQKQKENL